MTTYADTQYGSKVIASDRSNYWRYYGLHRDPFMPIVEDNNFYLPARWEQYFDLLQYLCESTNVLLSVVGVKGSGRTTFMRQFIAQASDTAKVCRLVGSTVLTAPQLSKTLIKDFNLPKPSGETTEEQWESLCHNMQSGPQPYLLVIDDAHRLPHETLKVLISLIKQQSEHQMRLHILLIGETQLTNMLNSLKEGEADRELIHTITLEPLSLQDTEAYIKHRLVAAGLPGGMPLRPTDIGRIYKLSEGVPGRINAVARQVLIDVMQQRQLYGFAHFIRTRRTQILGAGVILAVLFVLAALLTRGSNDPAYRLYRLLVAEKTTSPASSTATVNTNTNSITNSSTNTSTISSNPSDKTMVMPTAIINKAETQATSPSATTTTAMSTTTTNTLNTHNTLGNFKEASDNKSTNASPWYTSNMVEFKSSGAKHAGKNIEASKIIAGNPSLQQQTNVAATPSTTTTLIKQQPTIQETTGIRQQNKVSTTGITPTTTVMPSLQQTTTIANSAIASSKLLTDGSAIFNNPKHFTLQLVGVSSEAAVNKFINKNQLGDQAYYYHSKLGNKEWYVVIYGDFATKQEAQAALNSLPETVRGLHPWPRTMASVLESVRHGQTSVSGSSTTGASATARQITDTEVTIPSNTQTNTQRNTNGDKENITEENGVINIQ